MDEAARQAAIALGAYILEVSEMRAMQASDPEKAAIHGGEAYLRGKVDAYSSFVHMLETSFGVSRKEILDAYRKQNSGRGEG